jgi:hypothetical protein
VADRRNWVVRLWQTQRNWRGTARAAVGILRGCHVVTSDVEKSPCCCLGLQLFQDKTTVEVLNMNQGYFFNLLDRIASGAPGYC